MRYVEGQYLELEANPEYYGGEPAIKHLIFPIIPDPSTALAAIEKHEVDILSWSYGAVFVPEVARLREKDDLNVIVSFDRPGFQFIAFNMQHPILQNKWVRKAIAYSIPYDRIVNDVMLGLVEQANQIVPPPHPFYNQELPRPYYTYDLEKAKECLRKAGYPEWPQPAPPETPFYTYLLPAAVGVVVGVPLGYLVRSRRR